MNSWSGVAEAYRRSFAALCAGTIEMLLDDTARPGLGPTGGDAPGQAALRHLDVGCGTGELAVAAAGRGRQVAAADVDPDMIALTRHAVVRQTAAVTVLQAGSPSLPLPDASFDAITANFVVNHVPDPRATVRDLARLAAPSARIAVTIWPAVPGPHLAAYGEAARQADATPVPSTRLAPELDFPRSVEGLTQIAEEAGLRIEQAREVEWTWRISADDLMAGIAGGVATPGRIHQAQTSQIRRGIEQQARMLWGRYASGGLLAFPVTAVYVLAVRP